MTDIAFTFKTADFSITTCDCFANEWRKIKKDGNDHWTFDELENGKKSFRKFFYQKKNILHCCESCFEKALFFHPISLGVTVGPESAHGFCLLARLRNNIPTGKICNGCIWFFIEKYPDEFKIY